MNVSLNDPALLKELEKLEQIQGYYVGNFQFGLRQVYDFSIEQINEIKNNTNRNVFVCVNKLMHDNDLEALEQYLIALSKTDVDYVIFSDFAVSEISLKINASYRLIYGTETTITNHYFTELAKDSGFDGVELAKEITLAEVIEIGNNKAAKISIQIHGHMYMYQSVRKLIDNYQSTTNCTIDSNDELYLYDQERDNYYRVLQNEQGTHILASNDLCMVSHLDKVKKADVDFLKIDGFGYTKEQYLSLLTIYNKAFTDLENGSYKENKKAYLDEIKAMFTHKRFDAGFYFKETIY